MTMNYKLHREGVLQNRPGVGDGLWMMYYYQIDPPLCSGGSPPRNRFTLPATRERRPSMSEIGEKERDYFIYLKSYTNLGAMT